MKRVGIILLLIVSLFLIGCGEQPFQRYTANDVEQAFITASLPIEKTGGYSYRVLGSIATRYGAIDERDIRVKTARDWGNAYVMVWKTERDMAKMRVFLTDGNPSVRLCSQGNILLQLTNDVPKSDVDKFCSILQAMN